MKYVLMSLALLSGVSHIAVANDVCQENACQEVVRQEVALSDEQQALLSQFEGYIKDVLPQWQDRLNAIAQNNPEAVAALHSLFSFDVLALECLIVQNDHLTPAEALRAELDGFLAHEGLQGLDASQLSAISAMFNELHAASIDWELEFASIAQACPNVLQLFAELQGLESVRVHFVVRGYSFPAAADADVAAQEAASAE